MQKDTQTNMGLEYKKTWIKLLFSATVTLLLSSTSCAQQQKFRVTPHDLQVLEGSEALLRCEVTNQAGQVQWTKDGFALGFSAVIPGFPRYSVLGDRKQGVYNLRISNASIMDDADFQCQVGPARLNSAIRANAKLTVISPPSSIEIEGHAHNTKVEVKENKELTLKCTVASAKPASQIIWYRGNNEYKPDSRDDKIEEISPKRFTTSSQIKLKPMSEDDYTEYSCQAKHKALPPDMPMRSTVQLSVLYPPGAPYIEGYTQGETIRRGQTVELICRSRGGNPPAQLIWYKNGSQVRMAYRTSGRLSENIYTFTAQASDNKARFRCEANNIMSQNALKTEVELAVIFAPSHVSVTGPSEARVGDIVPLTCSTAPSNPPAEVKWMVGGRQIRNATSNTSVSPDGGWITTSNITALVEPNKRSLVVICNGLNLQMAENVVSTHTVNVLYPPTPPLISGYVEGKMIPAGSVVNLLCISSGGNPLATLTWYKNDKRVNSIIRTSDKSVTAEINILANVTDNQAQYRCEAQNSATEIPLFESTTLNVHFAPETVKIRVEPDELKPGNEAILVCDSSSSNPPAKLSWWKDGISIDENRTLFESIFKGIKNYSKPGLWGGTVSTLELRINVTQEMNGVVYTCQSSNEALQRSVHEAIALDVLYAPRFIPPPSSTVVGVESESLQVLLMANANPMSITYIWTKDGLAIPLKTGESKDQRIFSDGSTLNITKLHRNDAGIYKCEASNSQGTAVIHITVIVEYGTTIKSISENVVVNPGEDALLSCSVEGKPLNEEHVKWERMGYNMSIKTSTSFNNGTSSLLIKKAQREDVGNFRCVADNRVANPTNRDVLLIVKFVPEIEKSPILLRSASGTGERGRLSCRAQAAPRPSFTWLQLGKDLHINRTYKYDVEEKKIDFITYESTLIIEKVAPADYGSYECVVKNDLGETRENLRLEITSPPEPPLSLNILNITHDSVTIGWTPGFNGGLKASYRIRYREATTDQYKYIDAISNSHKLTISGLKMDTLYLFSITAINELGNSKYLPDLQRAHTKETPPPSQPASSLGGPPTTSSTPMGGTSGLLLFVGAAFGVIIVLLNVFIIGCCLHKRNQTRMKRRGFEFVPAEFTATSNTPDLVIIGISLAAFGFLLINAALVAWFFVHQKRKRETSNQTSKTATIEMYAPSSYNDTVTGETLSSVSEKSDSYSNEGSQPEYMEDARKKGTSTYLAENSDMPPPRYQKDGTLPSLYTGNLTNARTLPHPRNNTTNIDHRPRDDQMLLSKGVYIPSPSPAPPPDGSYYNMNSERYLSYPPMDYPQVDFSPTQLPITHLQSHPSGTFSGGSTLRRGIMRGIVGGPPPDVTHHTSNINLVHQQMPLDHNYLGNTISSSTQTSTSNASAHINNISHGSQQHNTTMPKLPQSILKDSKRNLQTSHILSNSSGQIMGIGVSSINPQSTSGTMGSIQLLNIQNSSGISNNLLVSGYESTPHNLSTFNTSTMAYTDADGHLV